jgi:hypothetical protein
MENLKITLKMFTPAVCAIAVGWPLGQFVNATAGFAGAIGGFGLGCGLMWLLWGKKS